MNAPHFGSMVDGLTELATGVPRKAWLYGGVAVAGIALAVGANLWHGHKVKQFGNERFAAGYAKAVLDGQNLKTTIDANTGAVTVDIRSKTDEKAGRISATADALRVSGPGKASARCPSVPAASGGHVAEPGTSDVAGAGVSQDERAAVPWGWLVSHAQTCDLNHNEVIAWREWHSRVLEAWPKPGAAQVSKQEKK